jgi:hypothetical protein
MQIVPYKDRYRLRFECSELDPPEALEFVVSAAGLEAMAKMIEYRLSNPPIPEEPGNLLPS